MDDLTFRCPETACTGWVSEVEDDEDTFWGCGECGTVWSDQDELQEAIQAAIEKYPYRKKCYKKSRKGWVPVDLEAEPQDYEDLVEQEWDDVDDTEDEEEGYPDGVDESCYRCPVSQCMGWVCWTEEGGFDGDKPAWECGWCGSTWYDKKNLMKEIAAIIKKFPYRKACYIGTKSNFKPAPIEQHPSDYDDQVEQEPEDQCEDSDRG